MKEEEEEEMEEEMEEEKEKEEEKEEGDGRGEEEKVVEMLRFTDFRFRYLKLSTTIKYFHIHFPQTRPR